MVAVIGSKRVFCYSGENRRINQSLRERMTDDQPLHISIGTRDALQNGCAYDYDRLNSLGVYVCTKGSDYARAGEFFVLKYENGEWIAWDSTMNRGELLCRQPVFKSSANVLEPGEHVWRANESAHKDCDPGLEPVWSGDHWQVSRVGLPRILRTRMQSVAGPVLGDGCSREELLQQFVSASNEYTAAQEEAMQARDAVPADRMVIRRAEKEEDKKLRLLQLWIWLAQQKEVAKRNQEVSSSAPRPHERPFGTTTRCSHHEHSLE